MSYEENRISDQIDGGLIAEKMAYEKYNALVREIAEEMAKEHNNGVGVAQPGIIQPEWFYKQARIALKRMADMFEAGYNFSYVGKSVREQMKDRGLIPEQNPPEK